ncbi:hypothetical protein BJ912DRAFT_1014340 [Pholiota molesta]|nr:hypothetical protein BJ912DRAFT_1014340 [Pholiota molesta]
MTWTPMDLMWMTMPLSLAHSLQCRHSLSTASHRGSVMYYYTSTILMNLNRRQALLTQNALSCFHLSPSGLP